MKNISSIADNLRLFHEQGDIIEVRIIENKTKTNSGYFSDVDAVEEAVKKYDGKKNIYFVLNKIPQACYSRENRDFILDYAKQTTTDADIECRRWVLIDFDPVRTSGTSSSDAEKETALKRARKCYKFLKELGFSEPIQADSGNGYHLLYKIDLPNNDESTMLVKQFLQSLAFIFSDEKIDIDRTVFNASRITKLYGTKAVKGADTPERPHRVSSIQYVPSEINITNADLIKLVTDMLPVPEQKQRTTPQQQSGSIKEFSIDDFISKHGIQIFKVDRTSEYIKYVLETCPFDSNHGKDSAIFQFTGGPNVGKLAFKCFHNGCANYGWQDFRLLYEPTAYDKQREYEQGQHKPQTQQYQGEPQEFKPKEKKSTVEIEKSINELQTASEEDETVKAILNRCQNVADIPKYDRSKAEIIRTGFETLDKNVDVEMGQVVFLTGTTGGGKSTVLGMLINETLEQGYNVFAYSGELRADKFQNWIDLQLAGSENCTSFTSATTRKTFYSVTNNAVELIHKWYNNRFFLYNNKESMKYINIIQTMEVYRKYRNCRVFFLDNFMKIDITDLADKELDAHKAFLSSLKDYAINNNVLIYLVIHPSKVKEGVMRMSDIQGSGNMQNLCDIILIIHRINNTYRDYYSRQRTSSVGENILSADNVIEVAKDRDNGEVDLYVPLKFDKASKRLVDKSYQLTKKYGWEVTPSTVPFNISDFEDIPT